MSESNVQGPRTNKAAIAAIIVTGIVILACIVAFTVITVTFLLNAPW